MARRTGTAVAGAFLLAAGGLGIGTAHADNASQICSSVGNAGTTHGACVSVTHGNPTALISDVCADPLVQQAAGVTNRGQCIKAARAQLP